MVRISPVPPEQTQRDENRLLVAARAMPMVPAAAQLPVLGALQTSHTPGLAARTRTKLSR